MTTSNAGAYGAKPASALASRALAHRYAIATAVLTAIALALRLAGINQTIIGDEFFTYDIVTRNGPRAILHLVHDTSITPPLHYLVAWAAVQLGDPEQWIRVPSIVFGTATVPLIYLLGARTVGRRAALVGAALFALSPFAVWYGDQARTYALLAFLVVVSTYSLLRALEPVPRRRWWWVLYVAASAGVIYAHYTGVFVLIAQAAWALAVNRHAARRVAEILVANAAVVVLYAPWIPSALHQRQNAGVNIFATLTPLTVQRAWQDPVNLLVGQGFGPWDRLLGVAGLALLAAAIACVAVALVAQRPPLLAKLTSSDARRGLIVVLAFVTPVALLLYSLVGSTLYIARNLSASLPALCLAIGAAVMIPRAPLRYLAAGCLVAAIAVATVRGIGPGEGRMPLAGAARIVNDESSRGDAVLVDQLFADPNADKGETRRDVLRGVLTIYLDRRYSTVASVSLRDPSRFRSVLARARRARDVFVVSPRLGPIGPVTDPARRLGARFRVVARHTVANHTNPVTVYELRSRPRP